MHVISVKFYRIFFVTFSRNLHFVRTVLRMELAVFIFHSFVLHILYLCQEGMNVKNRNVK